MRKSSFVPFFAVTLIFGIQFSWGGELENGRKCRHTAAAVGAETSTPQAVSQRGGPSPEESRFREVIQHLDDITRSFPNNPHAWQTVLVNLGPDLKPLYLFEINYLFESAHWTYLTVTEQYLKTAEPISLHLQGVPREKLTQWMTAAQSRLNSAKEVVRGGGTLPHINQVVHYISLLKDGMTPNEQKETVREIASGYARTLARNFPGMSEPKAFQYAKNLIRKKIGVDYEPLTELISTREINGSVTLKALSVDPIEGTEAPNDSLQIATKKLGTIKATKQARTGATVGSGEVRWKVGKKKYHGDYKVVVRQHFSDIARSTRKPDYDSMLADKKLTGLIMMHKNMGEDSTYVLNEYKEYYLEQGFRFGPPQNVSDSVDFIKSKITSGEVDYIFREAHSGGSRFLLTSKAGTVHVGKRPLPSGKQEVVYLFKPRGSDQHQVEFEELGDWMAQRAGSRFNPDLVYVDTSCFGLCNLADMLGKVGTSKLKFIAGSGSMDTFTNDETTALPHLISGIRKQKSFAQIREDIRQASRNIEPDENGQIEEMGTYTFPDQTEWRKKLRENSAQFNRPVNVFLRTFDPEGNQILDL